MQYRVHPSVRDRFYDMNPSNVSHDEDSQTSHLSFSTRVMMVLDQHLNHYTHENVCM